MAESGQQQRYCGQCGAEVRPGHKFCRICGEQFNSEPENSARTQRQARTQRHTDSTSEKTAQFQALKDILDPWMRELRKMWDGMATLWGATPTEFDDDKIVIARYYRYNRSQNDNSYDRFQNDNSYDRFQNDMERLEKRLGKFLLVVLAPGFAFIPTMIVGLPISYPIEAMFGMGTADAVIMIIWGLFTLFLWYLAYRW